ncbi:MAG: Bpu10I family restriction endonuclease [Candidatus Cloacimonetes bacterium]|nr:Bpu10I family restriction endonuclease [Candidatus Cloacimonadota bacterium]
MDTFRHGETIYELLEQEKNARKTMYLNEIIIQYKKWKNENLKIIGNDEEELKKKIRLYSDYRSFLFSKKFREESTFLKNRKLFETALSEFIYYIVKDLKIFEDKNNYLGRAEIPMNLKFEYENLNNIKNENILNMFNQKMRLVIGRKLEIKYRIQGRRSYFSESTIFPFIVVTTAMVLDEWFIRNVQNQVRRFKAIFSQSIFIIICEVISSEFKVDLNILSLDGIYILQQQTTKMRRKEISFDVVSAFLEKIQKYFLQEEEDLLTKIQKGILIE